MNVSHDWLEQRLEVVLARAADSVEVRPVPSLSRPMSPRSTRRRRNTKWWAAVGGAAAVVVSGGSIAAANLIGPHTYLDPLKSRVSPTDPAISLAVLATLPPGGHVVSSQHVTTSKASYDDTIVETKTGTYHFTVYQKFSSSELDSFSIPRIRLPGGTGWIGSNTSSHRSVYFLSNAGIGVYVSEDSSNGPPDQLQVIEHLTEQLADHVRTATQPAAP